MPLNIAGSSSLRHGRCRGFGEARSGRPNPTPGLRQILLGPGRRLGLIIVSLLLAGFVGAADIEEAQYNAAVALYNAGQWQAALKKIDERLALNPTDQMRARYGYARGLALEQGGKGDDVRAAYATVIEKFPAAPEANLSRVALVYLDYAAGRADRVIEVYPTIDHGPLPADDRRNLALMQAESLYTRDDAPATLAAYQAAIKLGADPQALASKLFHLYLRLGRHAELIGLTAQAVADVQPDLVALARTEALLALGRHAEVETEAAKVPANSALFARAAFARAQALIKLGKLTAAIDPLAAAIKGLRDPPAPASAHVALAECLVEDGRHDEAERSLARTAKLVAALPAPDRKPLEQQISTIRLRIVTASGDPQQIARAVAEAGDAVPAEQRAQLLYLRLHSLAASRNTRAILESLKTDQAVLQKSPADGSATLIWFKALKDTRRLDEGLALLEAYVARQPASPAATKARIELARAAMDREDAAKALEWLGAATAVAGAREVLGADGYADALYNQAVMAFRLDRTDDAIRATDLLIAANPGTNRLVKAHVLSGQSHLLKKDPAGAARHWTAALAAEGVEDEPGLREQLGAVLYATGDHAGAIAQFDQAAGLRRTDRKHARASQEAWARALFETGAFAAAGERFGKLYQAFRDAPAYAYEAAVACERAGQPVDAERWYTTALRSRGELPPDYAAAIELALARVRLESGLGDQGLAYWMDGLATATNEARFGQAATMVRRLIADGKLNRQIDAALGQRLPKLTVEQPEYFLLGALRLESLVALNREAEATRLAESLATAFAENEKSLAPQSLGASLAPAMIYYFRGELARQTGRPADALAAYETVLAVYPYNEWPDAAACGAAECYLSLNDTNTAVAKFGEVAVQPTNAVATARWIRYAQQRMNDLTKKE
ncbi:tetratricopeptide repeat protein [bacterium]|nr:tetratricopeptide repeat protein [bacterium]